MKRKDLIRLLEANGWVLEREGASHTIFRKNLTFEPIPRHREINEFLARDIIKRNGLQPEKKGETL